MAFYCRKANIASHTIVKFLFLMPLVLLAACGGSPSSTGPTGQQLLAKAAQAVATARTLQAIFNLSITGATSHGTFKAEVWNEAPAKDRVVVLQSSLPNYATGTVTVSDGQKEWVYSPVQKVVYAGALPAASSTGTPTSGSTSDILQTVPAFYLLQRTITQSDATLISSSAKVDGHSAYDVHVVSQSSGSAPQSAGEVYIDKATGLPVQVNLSLVGSGLRQVMDIPLLALNEAIPDNTFAFTPPAGTKVLPLKDETGSSAMPITLARAQQLAGFHLLSIPATQKDYVLQSVNALGSPGRQIYLLNYASGDVTFTIVEGKSLPNQADPSVARVSVRGARGTLSTDSANGYTTLYWMERGVGIAIIGPLTNDQVMTVARLLS